MTMTARRYRETKWRIANQIQQLVIAQVRFWPESYATLQAHFSYTEAETERLLGMAWPLTFACDMADLIDIPVRVGRDPAPRAL
jgi:hypothetical protein